MSDAKNMQLLNTDINAAGNLIVSIITTWPGLVYDNLGDLTAALAADVAWARRRITLGQSVAPVTQSRRQVFNRGLFEIFRDQPEAPWVYFVDGSSEPQVALHKPEVIWESWLKDAVSPPSATVGRPRKYSRDELENMLNSSSAAIRNIARKLKPKE